MTDDPLSTDHIGSDKLDDIHTAILYIINRVEAANKLNIKEELEEFGYTPQYGRLHAEINVLIDRGLVEGNRENQIYVVTSDGRTWLTNNRERVEQFLAQESNRRPDEDP